MEVKTEVAKMRRANLFHYEQESDRDWDHAAKIGRVLPASEEPLEAGLGIIITL